MSWGTRTGVTQASYKDVLDMRLVRYTEDFSTREYPEGTSQTFKAGQPVKFSSGVLIACVDADTVCAGVAVKDASGVANTPMPILTATRGKQFLMKCSTTPARATHVGNNYQVDLTAGLYTVDLSSSANPFFKVIDLPYGFDITTHENYQKAIVLIADAVIQVK